MNYQVSIIMPCYNMGEYVKTAIESVLNQDISVQLITIDDGSSDNTLDVLSHFSMDIHVLQSDHMGVANARNRGIEHISSPHALLLDADDALAPGSLRYLVEYMNPDKEEVIYGDYSSWDHAMMKRLYFHKASTLGREPLSFLVKRNISPPGAILFPADAFDRIGKFDQLVAGCEDWDFIIRLARAGYRFRRANREIFYYRCRTTSASKQAHKMLQSGLEVIRRCYNRDDRVIGDTCVNGYPKDNLENNQFSYYALCMGISALYTDSSIFTEIIRSIKIPRNPDWAQFGKEFRESVWWHSLLLGNDLDTDMLRKVWIRSVSLIKQVAGDKKWCRSMILGILSPEWGALLHRPGPKKALRLFREWKAARELYDQLNSRISGENSN